MHLVPHLGGVEVVGARLGVLARRPPDAVELGLVAAHVVEEAEAAGDVGLADAEGQVAVIGSGVRDGLKNVFDDS